MNDQNRTVTNRTLKNFGSGGGGGKLVPGIPGGSQHKSAWNQPSIRSIDASETRSGTYPNQDKEAPSYSLQS